MQISEKVRFLRKGIFLSPSLPWIKRFSWKEKKKKTDAFLGSRAVRVWEHSRDLFLFKRGEIAFCKAEFIAYRSFSLGRTPQGEHIACTENPLAMPIVQNSSLRRADEGSPGVVSLLFNAVVLFTLNPPLHVSVRIDRSEKRWFIIPGSPFVPPVAKGEEELNSFCQTLCVHMCQPSPAQMCRGGIHTRPAASYLKSGKATRLTLSQRVAKSVRAS